MRITVFLTLEPFFLLSRLLASLTYVLTLFFYVHFHYIYKRLYHSVKLSSLSPGVQVAILSIDYLFSTLLQITEQRT